MLLEHYRRRCQVNDKVFSFGQQVPADKGPGKCLATARPATYEQEKKY